LGQYLGSFDFKAGLAFKNLGASRLGRKAPDFLKKASGFFLIVHLLERLINSLIAAAETFPQTPQV
jgi:hypothetical protein